MSCNHLYQDNTKNTAAVLEDTQMEQMLANMKFRPLATGWGIFNAN